MIQDGEVFEECSTCIIRKSTKSQSKRPLQEVHEPCQNLAEKTGTAGLVNKKPKERRYCNYILVQGVFILLITLKGSLEMCCVQCLKNWPLFLQVWPVFVRRLLKPEKEKLVSSIINKFNEDDYSENVSFEFVWSKCCRNGVIREIK